MGRNKTEYIMYDTETDLPVCIGDIDECARCAGVAPSTLRSNIYRYSVGKGCKPRYEIYDIDKVIDGDYLEEGDEYGELCED